MDESPKQLIRETRAAMKMRLGREARVDFEYERCGVANIFLVSEPLKGKLHVEVRDKKTRVDWAKFIKQIADKWYKDAKKITLVMDNLATHKAGALYEVYKPKEAKRIWDRFEFVFMRRHLCVDNGSSRKRKWYLIDKFELWQQQRKRQQQKKNVQKTTIQNLLSTARLKML